MSLSVVKLTLRSGILVWPTSNCVFVPVGSVVVLVSTNSSSYVPAASFPGTCHEPLSSMVSPIMTVRLVTMSANIWPVVAVVEGVAPVDGLTRYVRQLACRQRHRWRRVADANGPAGRVHLAHA